MHTAFRLGIAIGILTAQLQCYGLDAGLFTGVVIYNLDLKPAPFCPALIHALEHLGPILAFRAARASVNLKVAVIAVGFAGEKRFGLVAFRAIG